MMKIKLAVKILLIIVLSSCSFITTKKILPGANGNVIVSTSAPDLSKCKFLVQINETQGNNVNELFTSNSKLEISAINTIKNEASKMGGNYVEIIVNKTAVGASNFQTNIDNVVNIYKCTYNKRTELNIQ